MNTKIACSFILGSLLLTSCGQKTKNENQNKSFSPVVPTPSHMEGVFQALLAPVNKKVSGHLNGAATIVKEKDDFIVTVRLSGGPPKVIHAQSIHIGKRCPDISDDLNLDGYIDAEEGRRIFDQIIIPLDNDISSQWQGLGTYPASDERGSYNWSRSTSFKTLMTDLSETDINLKDDFIKMVPGGSLNLVGNVVVIYGISSEIPLPDTVQGPRRQTPQQGLPIACGIIRNLTQTPGVIDNDETGIPAPPAGETIGGSGGSDDGADFSRGQTSGGNYGNDDV